MARAVMEDKQGGVMDAREANTLKGEYERCEMLPRGK